MKLIVGLGNPGEKYVANRHNVGFLAVDEVADLSRCSPWKKRFQGLACEGQIGSEKCILLKPGTYMNESGRAVGEAMRFYKLTPADVVVIHDELDLKPGAIRVKVGGGNAGHNGLKSISAHIGNDYKRVRLGIGHPGDKTVVAHYVLQDFAKADKTWLEPLIEGVAKGMGRLLEGNDASFLNEAARGRSASASAAVSGPKTMTGLEASPAPVPPSFETVGSEPVAPPLEELLAVTSKPIEAMPQRAFAPMPRQMPTFGAQNEEAVVPLSQDPVAAGSQTNESLDVADDTAKQFVTMSVMPIAAREGGSSTVSTLFVVEEPKAAEPAAPVADVQDAPSFAPIEARVPVRAKSLRSKFKSWLHTRVRGAPLH